MSLRFSCPLHTAVTEVFAHFSATAVQIRRALLEKEGISTFLRNEALSTLYKSMAAPFHLTLCVMYDDDYPRAMALIGRLTLPETRIDWTCPECKEMVPAAFDSCWNCEAMRPGSVL